MGGGGGGGGGEAQSRYRTRRTAATTRSGLGFASRSSCLLYGIGTSAWVTRSTGASSWSNASRWITSTTWAPMPQWGQPSSTTTARLVRATEPTIAASSSGRSERRSSTSAETDRKSTRLNSSHGYISYAVFC